MENREVLDQNKTRQAAKNSNLKLDKQLFDYENTFLTQTRDDYPHDISDTTRVDGRNAEFIKKTIFDNFKNYKFIGDARLELSVNLDRGVEKDMGGTKRKFRSHMLGSDLRRKRINMEEANAYSDRLGESIESFRVALGDVNKKEFAQIFNSMDLSKIDLSTDEKVVSQAPRMTTLMGMLRHNAILDNHFISKEKLELVTLLVDYFEARMALISDADYSRKYNSELRVTDITKNRYAESALQQKISKCREMAYRIQDIRVAANSDKAVRAQRMDKAIDDSIVIRAQREALGYTDAQALDIKEIDIVEGSDYMGPEQMLRRPINKVVCREDTRITGLFNRMRENYANADEIYQIASSFRYFNLTNYRYTSKVKSAFSAFNSYFCSQNRYDMNEDEQQEYLRAGLKSGRKFVNSILPGGFDGPNQDIEQNAMDKNIRDLLEITGGDLEVPEDVKNRLKTSKNPYYKKFYSWISKKDSVLFVHPPVPDDVKDIEKGIPNLRVALSAIVYDNSNKIRDCIIDNQDGTVTVRFYEREKNDPTQARAVYVRVDKTLPDLVGIDNKDKSSLWVRFIEKAYAAQYGNGKYDGASNELPTIMERLVFSHVDDIFKEGYNLSEIFSNSLDDIQVENAEEVQTSMDKAVKECREKYKTVSPTVIQVMEYATQMAYLRNQDREYAEKYLVAKVGLNMDLTNIYTGAAISLIEDFENKLNQGEIIFVKSTARDDDADKMRKKEFEGRGILMDHEYQVLEISQYRQGHHAVILRDPYVKSGTHYNGSTPEKFNNSDYRGCFAMELNDFMNVFNKVVG